MQHPFLELQKEYAGCIAKMTVTRPGAVDVAAKKILLPENINRYIEAVQGTPIPAAWLGAIDMRESSCNPHLGLGQGDPWNEVSRHVPKGFGPFPSWVAAAKFYLHYDHLDVAAQPWTIEYACWKGEMWNGFGPRAHGRATGYLWAGTNIYLGGKFIADGEWSSGAYDQQLGIIPIILRIAQLRPDLAIGTGLPVMVAPSIVPPVLSPPEGVGGGSVHNALWIQQSLNLTGIVPQLVEDGSYGRATRRAVRSFQQAHGLTVDGLAGTGETIPAIEKAIEAILPP